MITTTVVTKEEYDELIQNKVIFLQNDIDSEDFSQEDFNWLIQEYKNRLNITEDVHWLEEGINYEIDHGEYNADQFYVLLTHVPSNKASAKFQQVVVRNFPNVSIVDLGLILTVVDELLDKIGYIIKFMSAFSIITGLVVLIASVRISKYQRIQESVLLRTLGASRKQIFAITALEYLFLGTLSALTGILIAVSGTWLLAKYSFEIPFAIDLMPAVILFFVITPLMLLICLLALMVKI